ncbi:RIIa domain-containing protein 1-like [Gigantopelta aegis]|uniref:RIIa domain-containing protein 1-like n=1 Tax=Gigantopelta aegis TaxID=1735272 RepID=UPI001B888C45|nr:RIIa domain-containing protein 1-like [Gigantopelta aegis]
MAEQPQHKHPEGMEPYDLGGKPCDLGALSPDQQEELNKFKIQTRMQNELYLRDHPEVECLLASFLSDVLIKRPENIREFASDFFTHPSLPDTVEKQLEIHQQKIKQNKILQSI